VFVLWDESRDVAVALDPEVCGFSKAAAVAELLAVDAMDTICQSAFVMGAIRKSTRNKGGIFAVNKR
jgi:hypothetical protein